MNKPIRAHFWTRTNFLVLAIFGWALSPLATADAQVHALALRRCELEAGQLNRNVAARVQLHLALHEQALPTLAQTARVLCLSARSLSRALQQEGSSYQRLLDQLRAERAVRLLAETDLPVDQIGFRLGFADPSNFIRAFRRWHGRSPGEFRR